MTPSDPRPRLSPLPGCSEPCLAAGSVRRGGSASHVEAGRSDPGDLGLAATALGLPTVLVTCTIDVRSVLDVKRAAMEAHASQIRETSSDMRLPSTGFAAVYGF